MLGHEHSAPPGTRRHLCPPPSAAGRLPRNQAERPGAAHTIAAHRCHLELRGFSQLTRKGLRSPPRGRCVCAALSCRNRGVFRDGRTESDSPPPQKSLGTAWVTGTEGTACARALAWPAVCSNGVTTLAVGSRTPRGTVTHGRWPRYPGASGLTSHEPTETRQRGLLGGIFLTEKMIVFVFPTVVFTSIFRKERDDRALVLVPQNRTLAVHPSVPRARPASSTATPGPCLRPSGQLSRWHLPARPRRHGQPTGSERAWAGALDSQGRPTCLLGAHVWGRTAPNPRQTQAGLWVEIALTTVAWRRTDIF